MRNYHMTAVQAAELARQAGAGKLMLIHLSDRYPPEEWPELLNEAREVFPGDIFPADVGDRRVELILLPLICKRVGDCSNSQTLVGQSNGPRKQSAAPVAGISDPHAMHTKQQQFVKEHHITQHNYKSDDALPKSIMSPIPLYHVCL